MSPGPIKGTEDIPWAIISDCVQHPKREQRLLDPSLLHKENKTILRILLCSEDAEERQLIRQRLPSFIYYTVITGVLKTNYTSRSTGCIRKAGALWMPAERNAKLFPISCIRRERISHIRAVMTILWERLAYAGSVSTLNPEIQKKKQKSHKEFILLKIPSLRLLQNSSKGSKLHEKESHALWYTHTASAAAVSECLHEAQNSRHHTNTRNAGEGFSYQHSTPKSSAMQAAGISGTSQLLTHFHQSNHYIRERRLCSGCMFTVGLCTPSNFRNIWGEIKNTSTYLIETVTTHLYQPNPSFRDTNF